MAWTDEARRAALEARRRNAGTKKYNPRSIPFGSLLSPKRVASVIPHGFHGSVKRDLYAYKLKQARDYARKAVKARGKGRARAVRMEAYETVAAMLNNPFRR